MAQLRTITSFKSQLKGGGARPNLFEVNLGGSILGDLGWADSAQTDFHFLCKATSIPTQTIGSVDVPFRGRILKVAGDRTFEPWSVTVINDEAFNIRSVFEKWGDKINGLHDGVGVVEPQSYMGNGTVAQLSRSTGGDPGKTLQSYMVQDIWPSEIGSIDLSYESSDAIEEFTVTFQVQYMSILNQNAGNSALGEPLGVAESAN
tara:strand:+ start:42 stop:653 length:612 start_codon:yes stop_codon:yes gene_type:complete